MNNPVPGVSITFLVTSFPAGGGDYSFSAPGPSGTTGPDGRFQATFTAGNKVGTYLISAVNEELINSGQVFFSIDVSAGNASRIVFITESGLADTVATTYGDSVRVRIEDDYENVISGVTVNWDATSTGTVNPVSSVSNSNGIAATQWTLRQATGTDTLYARSAGLPDNFITAQTRAGLPFSVIADSGNFRSSIAGGTQIIRARLEDQYGNVVPNRNIRFRALTTGGFISNPLDMTDSDGYAQTTYRSPANRDTSNVTAYISGVDTANYELYGIRYVDGTLNPYVVSLNDTVDFSLDITNPGPDTIGLDTSMTIFSFADGAVTTKLDSPLTIVNGINHLKFKSALMDNGLTGGNFTPEISFTGLGTYAGLNGTLQTNSGELSVEPVHIEYVRVPVPRLFPRGELVQPVLLNVANTGNYTVVIDSVTLTFSPVGFDFQPVLITPLDSLLSGEERTLQFAITIPDNAPADTFIVDGYISCTCTGTGAILDDMGANQTDYLVVTEALNLVYNDFTPKQVSEGQNVAFQMQINNLGTYDILLSRANSRLQFGAQQFLLTTNQALQAGAVNTLNFEITPLTLSAINSPFDGVLYLQGTENGNIVNDTLYTADGSVNFDSLTVQTPSALQFLSVELSDTSVRQGQTGESITIRLNNTGQTDAIIQNPNDVTFNITNDPSAYTLTSQQTYPFTIGGESVDSLVYNIRVAADAPTGIDSFTVDIDYEDLNNGQVSTLSDPGYFDSWTIFTPGVITISSVQSAFDSVSTGQQNIPVTVRIHNPGQTAVRIDSVRLRPSRGFYIPSSLYTLSNKVLNAAESDTFNLFISLQENSVTGTATLDASAYGVRVSDLSLVEDTDADTTDSWLIQRHVEIYASDNQPTQISANQGITPTVTIDNDGSARLIIDNLNSYVEAVTAPAFQRNITSPLVIEGNANNLLLNFAGGAENIGPGTYQLNLHLEGTENGAAYQQDILLPNSLIIQAPAVMNILSVTADPVNISRGIDTTITIQVTNTGQSGLQIDSLLSIPYGIPLSITPSLPYSLTGGSSISFTARINIPVDADTGLIALDARGVGMDENSSAIITDNSADITDSWNVFTPSDITITAITATDTIARLGQENIPVSMSIRNNGASPARINSIQLNEQIGLYEHSYPATPFIVNGHTTVTDLVYVLSNSSVGSDTLTAQLNYTNIYSGSGTNYNSSEYLAWEIVSGQASVDIISVNADKINVSRGQSDPVIQVRIENTGGSSARINSIDLVFTNGNSNYTISPAAPAMPFVLASGLQQIFQIPVTVNTDAQTGLDSVYASTNFTQLQSGDMFTITRQDINDQWNVQLRPSVSIDSVRIEPKLVSTGQTGLTGSVFVSNASGANRAGAQIDTVNFTVSSGGADATDQFDISRFSTPALPQLIQPGSNSRYDFDVDVPPGTMPGNYEVNGYVVSQDINDGQDSTDTSSDDPDSLTIEGSGSLAINSVFVIPDTVSLGQTNARIYVDYQNNGGASIEIRNAQLDFSPVDNFNEDLESTNTPFTIPGGQRDTLEFSILIPDGYTGNVDISASITGRDLNTGTEITVDSINAVSFLIQHPADIRWVSGSTSPTTIQVDSNVTFHLEVRNDGEADVQLNPTLTTLQLENTLYDNIQLSDTSANILSPDSAITPLSFTETFISGIAEGEYPIILHLNGTSNGAPFSSTLDVGIFAFGDSLISITSVAILDNRTFLQGDSAIEVVMTVANNGEAAAIDNNITETTLMFKEPLTGAIRNAEVLNLTRLDALDTLQTSNNNQLRFRFDLSASFPLGITNIFGQISLDNNQLFKESSTYAELDVQTSGNATYLVNSLYPDTVIARERVSFQADFYNSGSSNFVLNPDSSYLTIVGTTIDTLYLAGQYTLSGSDTLTLNYELTTIPESVLSGDYSLYWYVNGILANHTPYQNSGTVPSELTIVPGANIVVNQTNIGPELVRQGETGINVSYDIQNTGQSDAIITNLNHIFRNGAFNVTDDWLPGTTILFPDTLKGGQLYEYNLVFNITSVVSVDSVLVVEPARIRIDSLIAVEDSDAPNAPYVNIDSNFNLRLSVSNTGSDTIQSATFRVYRENQPLPGLLTINDIPPAPDSVRTVILPQTASALGTITYRVSVVQALDGTGNQISIDQPLDNREEIFVQQPSELFLSSRISAPAGATDRIVSLNQQFTLEATVNRNGQSDIGPGSLVLRLPSNYTLVPSAADSIRNFGLDSMTVEWEVMPTGLTTAGFFDSLEIFMTNVPVDSNTLNPVMVSSLENKIGIQVQNQGAIAIEQNIVSPSGALDSVLTAGQSFKFRGTINFNSSVASEGRTAQIILPENYSIENNSPVSLAAADEVTVEWDIVASPQPDNLDTLAIQVNGFDANSGAPLQNTSDSFILRLVSPAQISLGTSIINPPGAIDNVVSTGQEIVLRTQVTNIGQAGFDTSGTIQMTAGNGIVFKHHRITGVENSPTNVIPHFQAGNYTDTLIVPNNQTTGQIFVQLPESGLPVDENSNEPVLVRRDSSG
ncbi:MAG: Ig-like domain-containing protein, partial [Calditrichaceae bacterium]